ncbi:translation initiation factor eIF3 subunit [Dothidotthia symphoricarpi CBS 119687]|uniref:Eukaryotic translation initiation factor 3 subunit J n=1 Tax=Dothidotthia symphoricarpi CBS 119687 TaxID=1392245 RepID=A0A6A6AUI7_9PLEO|nr:translation initiation factor eIF3 subunit [Dothidotthia symphoricarpi CBS 119687]KAF2134201.1 translation initiation factor eIF3 subunit [Dothidotthia symphoricarpi CBS 119687]
MAPGKWDDEEGSSSPSSPTVAPIARRSKFEDEEDDSDVLESWDAAEDSEVEREKAKKAAEAKEKAEAEAKANKKSKSQRIEEHREAARRRREEDGDYDSEDSEDEAERRARLRQQEIDGSRAQAEELFGDLSNKRASKAVTLTDESDPGKSIDLSTLHIFNPNTKDQFTKLRDTLVPLLVNNSKKGQYSLFLQEFTKQIAKELPSEQIKKIASGLTTLSNEKMKEEKAAEKGGKKTKAAKTKSSLVATRDVGSRADTQAYEDDFGDDDFM